MEKTTSVTSGAPSKAVHDPRSLLCRMTNAERRRVIGGRFLEARELNGYQQVEAANLFGYKNSAQLSQWERGQRMPPIPRILQASSIYRVSLDYLFGISNEPDRDPINAERLLLMRNAESVLSGMTQKIVDAMLVQTRECIPVISAAKLMVDEGDKLMSAFIRFRELNLVFDEEMKGSARLANAFDSFRINGLGNTKDQLERQKHSARKLMDAALHAAGVSTNTPQLFDLTTD